MAEFFQNVFNKDFHGTIYGIGLEESPINWTIGANQGRSTNSVVHWAGPGVAGGRYNLTGKTTLTVKFARPASPNAFFNIAVDVTATAAAAGSVSIREIVTDLNADSMFSTLMTASVIDGPNEVKDATHGFADGGGVAKQIDITGKVPGEFYVLNGSAEEVLKFNKKAPVKELLTFFKRYAWDVAGDPVEAAATGDKPLIWLNVADTDAQAVITTAGLVYGDKQDDYQLFKGNVGEYQFVKNTYNASSPYNHEEQIIFNAGAVVGDPATKTTMEYTNDKMTKSFTVPHVLVSGDLITP